MGLLRRKKKEKPPSMWKGRGNNNPLGFKEAFHLAKNWVKEALGDIPHIRSKMKDIPGANFALAEDLFMQGEITDALMRYKLVLRFNPAHAEARFKLGRCYQILGNTPDAIACYHDALKQQPDHSEAHFMLVALGQSQQPITQVPLSLVEEHFTRIAPAYLQGYVLETEYTGHLEAGRALKAYAAIREEKEGSLLARLDILDIGCGTGLAGKKLAPYASNMVGVDISQAMLDHIPPVADDSPELYSQTIKGEAAAYLAAQPPLVADIINASGMLNYNGDITAIMKGAAHMLRDKGAFLFSVEQLPANINQPFGILPGIARFGHTKAYLEQLAPQCGLQVQQIRDITLYKETPGLQCIFIKRV